MDIQVTIQEIVNTNPKLLLLREKPLWSHSVRQGHWHVSPVVSMTGWSAFLSSHGTDDQFHHLAGFLLCRQHHHYRLPRQLFTNNAHIWNSRDTAASQQKYTSCFCNLVTVVEGQMQSR